MPYQYRGWTLYRRVGESGTMILFFSKSEPVGGTALGFLPDAYEVATQKKTNHPYVTHSLALSDPYERAFYKMWAGEPLADEDRSALHLMPGEPDTADPYGDRIDYSSILKKAQDLEYVGRFEEAAVVYERLGRRDDARRVRTDSRSQTVRTVKVDLNQLLEQVRAEGLVLGYHCPKCGSPVEISGSTPTRALRSCAACGTTFETMAIADFLKQNLS